MFSPPSQGQSVFDITHHEEPASETLIVGFAEFGLAGLTAVNHLVDHSTSKWSGP